ncbi:hypothetical protein [Hydrogenibacillus sp. N12]|uniref:hypothetical protein n=1 Tax=Hydrogenibacillus sp. N12 TaxID=2866627 RepID=UPI001C7CA3C6|nr:hypothetical protein [Hydrogenibacillus sp. N12]QZA32056.1 hypothetical protein K2M58_06790 [Hydrogenibacillus sp. N12]
MLLKTLRIPRATGDDQKKRREAEKKRRESDAALKSQIEAILREHPESGDRRLEAELRRRGMVGGWRGSARKPLCITIRAAPS